MTFGPPGATLSHESGELRFRGEPVIAGGPGAPSRSAQPRERDGRRRRGARAGRGGDGRGLRRSPAFPGVRHRLEEVATRDGVLYVNDSKATNVAAAIVGIEAFHGGVHAILGGSIKGGGFRGLRDAVAARCRACYLVGEAADRLAEDLEGTAPLHRCGDLDRAFAEAARAAAPGEVVLLSPACASYDQYRDYEERGDHFRALALAAGTPS